MTIALQPLPYDHDALEPYVSARAVTYHHDKLQRAYADNTNRLLARTRMDDAGLDREIGVIVHDRDFDQSLLGDLRIADADLEPLVTRIGDQTY